MKKLPEKITNLNVPYGDKLKDDFDWFLIDKINEIITFLEPKEECTRKRCWPFEEIDFLQVGKAVACGHCQPEKFGEGLKQAEAVIKNYQCDCSCHTNRSTTGIEQVHNRPVETGWENPAENLIIQMKKANTRLGAISVVESMLPSLLLTAKAEERKRIEGVIEEMKNSRDTDVVATFPTYDRGYMKALSDILTAIK